MAGVVELCFFLCFYLLSCGLFLHYLEQKFFFVLKNNLPRNEAVLEGKFEHMAVSQYVSSNYITKLVFIANSVQEQIGQN